MRIMLLGMMSMALCGMTGCGSEPKTIVCLGDSLTACGGEDGKYSDWLGQWLPEHTILNKGVGGDTLAGGRARFAKDVLELKPDVVIIELGANDFWQQKRSIEELKNDLADMVRQAKAAGIEVVIASCFGERDYQKEKDVEFKPERFDYAQAIAQMEREVCKEYACFYVPNMQIDIKPNGTVPYWDDTNHPSKMGNELVAKRILTAVKKALKKAEK